MSRPVIIVIALLILGIIALSLISFFSRPDSERGKILPIPIFNASPSPGGFLPRQIQDFKVVDTSPKDKQTEVSNGEIIISFTTDNEIVSEKAFSLNINPPLPHYWKFTNSYPTKTIAAQVFGGLKPSTTHSLTVKNMQGNIVHGWSFITSAVPAQSTSGYVADYEKSQADKFYPLIDFVPYISQIFDLGYTSELTLRVAIKNPDVEKVEKEVEEWIRSKGVDPATHKINYINSF